MKSESSAEEISWPVLSPEECSRHLSDAVVAAYAEIVAGFVQQAKAGSCQHLKTATEIVEATVRQSSTKEKGTAELLLEKYGGQFGFEVEEGALSN